MPLLAAAAVAGQQLDSQLDPQPAAVPLSSSPVPLVPAEPSYLLADGWDGVLTRQLDSSFSCDGRQYGYFADVYNDCQLFHVCMPIVDSEGQVSRCRTLVICSSPLASAVEDALATAG